MTTLLARLVTHAAQRPNSQAYRLGSTNALTYEQLHRGVVALAALLQRRVQPGGVIILSCTNNLEYPVAFLGILAAGCTVFPISPDAADIEMIRAAKESNAAGVIGDERAVSLLASPVPLAMSISELPKSSDVLPTSMPCGDLLLQSSGTTATPKMARRSGRSLDFAAMAIVEAVEFTEQDRVLMTVPLTHSYGLEHGLLAPLWAGSCVHLSGLLPIDPVLSELGESGITVLPGVPSTFEMLAASSEQNVRPNTLRAAYSAGAPLPRAIFDAFAARFGIRVSQLYGATEIGSVTFNSTRDPFDPQSVGRPMRDVSIRILTPVAKKMPLANGEEGQIVIRAGSMFNGYLNGSADLIDGHFPTGDLGYVDDKGRLFVTGRIKLLIDIGGRKVNPLEVESVLRLHPLVQDCVVVPVRQSDTVFRLKAVVTPRDPSTKISVDELRQLAREHLSAYKIPRIFEVRVKLPRSATGKILRHLVEKE
jgi:long-chain acyl-CoA synthetase